MKSFPRRQFSKSCLTSILKKGSTLKGKNLLPLGANSFLLKRTPFRKGLVLSKNTNEVTRLSPLLSTAENLHVPGMRSAMQLTPHCFTLDPSSFWRSSSGARIQTITFAVTAAQMYLVYVISIGDITFLPAALLCLFIIAFFFFPTSSPTNILLKSSPKSKSSPHPPHLKSPCGASLGNAPQLHFVVIPMLHARAIAWVKDAEARA